MESDKSLKGLSLAEAQRLGRIEEFVRQQEALGVGPIDRTEFDTGTEALVKVPRSANRTSHSASGESSTGKKTRRGSDQGA